MLGKYYLPGGKRKPSSTMHPAEPSNGCPDKFIPPAFSSTGLVIDISRKGGQTKKSLSALVGDKNYMGNVCIARCLFHTHKMLRCSSMQ